MIAHNKMEPVMAIVLFTYYNQLGSPAVLLLGQLMEFIKDFNLSAERVYALLQSPEFPKEQFGSRHLDNVKGEIRFDKVSFSYKNFNLCFLFLFLTYFRTLKKILICFIYFIEV